MKYQVEKNLIRSIYEKSSKKIFYFIIGLFPKSKNKIVLESHPDFTDSTKVLYDYLIKNGKRKYKFIWLVDNPKKYNKLKIKNTKFINVNKPVSLKYLYHVITTKTLIFCNREIRWIDLNKQIVINLTHGIPIKSCRGKFPTGKTFTHVVSPSENLIPIVASEYTTTEDKCFVADLPRDDLLFEKNDKVEKLLKDYRKVIVWLPTYRKHKSANIIDADKQTPIPLLNEKELEELNEKLKKNNDIMFLKFHPAEDVSNLKKHEYTNVKILPQEEFNKLDIHLYSLLAYTDALITDYSSVSTEYVLLNRPIGYVLDDIDEYQNKRGFCIENIEDIIAGPKILTAKDLFKFIDDVCNNVDNYKKERKKSSKFLSQISR